MASGPPFPPPYSPDPSPYEPPPTGAGEYRWLAPATLQAPGGMPPTGQPGRAAMYDLRPLSTGEVLDRTFSLYRSRFLLFAGIAAMAAAVRLVASGVQLGIQQSMLRRGMLVPMGLAVNLLSLAASAIALLAFALTQAATMWAMGEVYLGRTASVTDSLRAVMPRWLRYIGIALWQLGSGIWPALVVGAAFGGYAWATKGSFNSLSFVGSVGLFVVLLLAALIVGVFLYLRNLLAVPVAVREGLKVRAAMRRSKVLAQGAKGKLFLVLLVAGALYMVMSIIMGTVLGIYMFLNRSTLARGVNPVEGHLLAIGAISLAIGFVGYTLISPVIMLGISLVYYDQRVRKEAFDVAVLLGDESAPGAVPVSYAAPPAAYPGYGASPVPPYAAPTTPVPPPIATQADLAATPPETHPFPEVPPAEPQEPESPVQEPPEGASGI